MIAIALVAGDAPAHAKRKNLRAEIATLKARIAAVESAVDIERRRGVAGVAMPGYPATGICGDPCAADSDGDGIGDCEDVCPCDATNVDGDADGVPDCADPCPDDASDACIDPCRMDSDGDGVVDCEDPCPWTLGGTADGDGDGVPDCADPCPEDKTNDCSPVCALDADGDGVKDCIDPCPWGETAGPCVLVPLAMPVRR
ncbi:MAG: thrombospondin type 3 repeat-containing protein [Candidatus Binatia bacterium]